MVSELEMKALHEVPAPDTADPRFPVHLLPSLLNNHLPVAGKQGLPALPAVLPVVIMVLGSERRVCPDDLLDFSNPAVGFEF